MSKFKPVTPGQLKCCGKMATEKGVSRTLFERGLNNGALARYLDSLHLGGITLPTGVTSRIEVIDVRRTSKSPKQKIILLNYPNGEGSFGHAAVWGEKMGLKKTNRDSMLLIHLQHPDLHKKLSESGADVFIVSTEEDDYRQGPIPRHVFSMIYWGGSDRQGGGGSSLPIDTFKGLGSAFAWFAFRM